MRRLLLILLLGLFGCDEAPSGETLSEEEAENLETSAETEGEEAATDDGAEDGAEEAPDEEAREAQAQTPRARELCPVPAIPIPRPRACVQGREYPECKWQMPHATLGGGRYRRWRNTIMEHWWGRPALVAYILGTMERYEQRFPEQVVAIGDLDAPGPRHRTHDKGVDFDIYLLGALMTENAGGGRYPSNYAGKSEEEVEELREHVLVLAQELATCADGAVRIYYNDDPVLERFHAWYDEQGFPENPFGRPMQKHNQLHDFHFHVTIPEDLPLLPMTPLPDGEEHPIAPIIAPPPPSSAAFLSSMTRRPRAAAESEDDASGE